MLEALESQVAMAVDIVMLSQISFCTMMTIVRCTSRECTLRRSMSKEEKNTDSDSEFLLLAGCIRLRSQQSTNFPKGRCALLSATQRLVRDLAHSVFQRGELCAITE